MAVDTHVARSISAGHRVWWRGERFRSLGSQVAALGVVALIVFYFAHNASVNMSRQGIASGFGFLSREAGFGIGTTTIDYSPADTYGRALLVGLLNTLLVSVIGCVLTTIFG